MTSKDWSQLTLVDAPAREDTFDVSIGMIRKRPTFLRAFNLAIEASAKEDKTIYSQVGIDASHWTRIRNGAAFVPGDERFCKLWDVLGNEIPLIWWAEKRGYDWSTIRKHQDDKDRALAASAEREKELALRVAVLEDLLRARR